MKIVIIGANAAGAKAAAKAKRVNPSADVLLIDRESFISYGACGIPYYLGDVVSTSNELRSTPNGVIRNELFFRQVKGVEVVTQTEAVEIDRESKIVTLYERTSGKAYQVSYDRLILATGSHAAIPPLENLGCPNILTLKSISDAEQVKEKAVADRAACIVGRGLIGLETAEALVHRGMKVTVVEMRDHILPGVLDVEMARVVENHLRAKGVAVATSCKVVGFDGTNRVERAITTQGEVAGDLVILAPGVAPNVTLAENCGLKLGVTGAIAVDDHMRTSDPDIFACGDCCEATHILTGKQIYHPLGSTANKQGRVAGINAAGGDAKFGGIIGTTIVKVFDYNVGTAGLTETEAKAAKIDVETALVAAFDHAHFYPGAAPITVKLMADKAKGRLMGIQAIGIGAIDKRVDTAIAAMTFGATVEQLSQLDLAYAPPYATAMDSLIVAADVLKNKLSGEACGIGAFEVMEKLKRKEDFLLLDVRSPAEHAEMRIEGAKLIPLGLLRQQLSTLPRDKEIIAFCKLSLRGYEAQRILQGAGFANVKFMEGGIISWPFALQSGSAC